MKVINIGRTPPPIGGVSYFLKRLKPYLDEAQIENILYDVSGLETIRKSQQGVICKNPIRVLGEVLVQPRSIVVFHSCRLSVLMMAAILSCRHLICIFGHGESILDKKNIHGLRYYLLRRISYILVPTCKMEQQFKQIFPALNKRIYSIPFILFPKGIPILNIPEIIALKKKTDFLLSAYAYKLSFFKGQDLYGVDLMVELIHRLNVNGYNAGLVLVLPDCSNKKYFDMICDKIRAYKIEGKIVIVDKPLEEACSLYKFTDVYIRPTNTDGDSFSVWESLYSGVPVIASDAVVRPDGCILFHDRDIDDFYEKVIEVFLNLEYYRKKTRNLEITGSEEALIDFFSRIS